MDEWFQRYLKFKDSGWSLRPASYQLRNPDGTPGGWIAQVQVWEDHWDKTTVRPILEREPQVYGSQELADAVGFRIGVVWLENNVGAPVHKDGI